MATERQKADGATTAVGYSLAAGGGGVSSLGVRRLKRQTGLKDLHSKPLRAMLASRRIPKTGTARALYAGGRALTAVGTAGAVHGTTRYFQDSRVKKSNLLSEGLEGQVSAVKDRVDTTKDKHTPLKNHVISLGLGAFGGLGAAKVTGKAVRGGAHFPAKAMATAAGVTATVPVSNKINNHFKVRARRKPVRPSSKASSVEARSSRGADPRAARSAIVPVGKIAPRLVYHGTDAASARKIMRTGRFKASVGEELSGGEGVYTTSHKQKFAAQGYAIGRASAKRGAISPSRGKVVTSMAVGPARGETRDGGIAERVYHPSQLIPVQSDGVKAHRVPELMSELRKMDDPSEVHVNGTLQTTGKKRARQPTPYELMHRRGKVAKLNTGMTPAEARQQLQRKKRKLVADVASTSLGIGGLTLLGASHPASGLKAAHRARLARAAGTTAVLGGGVSALNGIQGIKIAHHDIKAQNKVVKSGVLGLVDDIPTVANAASNVLGGGSKKVGNGRLIQTPPPAVVDPMMPLSKAFRIPGFRSSYLRTRRLSNGTLKATRVNGGVVR